MATATTALASSMREQAHALKGEADRLMQAASVLDPDRPIIRKAGTTRRRRVANGRRTRSGSTKAGRPNLARKSRARASA